MSDVIVQMEMPKACRWKEDGMTKRCPIAEWGGACAVTKQFEPSYDNRPPWCPIKGVLPDEHNRLVSEKDVRWAIDDIVLEIASRTGCVAMTKDETMEYVKRLPTIVAAERREK